MPDTITEIDLKFLITKLEFIIKHYRKYATLWLWPPNIETSQFFINYQKNKIGNIASLVAKYLQGPNFKCKLKVNDRVNRKCRSKLSYSFEKYDVNIV